MLQPLLDTLLSDIEDNVSTFHSSVTLQSRSTIVGLNTLSGKTIMAVGRGIIRGVDYVAIQAKLRRIRKEQQLGLVSDRSWEDILEFQRL